MKAHLKLLQRTDTFSFYCRELGQKFEPQKWVAGTVSSLGITISTAALNFVFGVRVAGLNK
jgi:hypothetical protein